MPEDLQQHPVLALWDAGYQEIIPVVPPNATISSYSNLTRDALGKTPGRRFQDETWGGFRDWPKVEITRAQVEQWVRDGASFGLRTKHFATVDVDVFNPELASVIEEVIIATLGQVPKRVGRAPKFAMPFRSEQPFGKMRIELFDEEGKKYVHAVEILCKGQQFVVHGEHPATGAMYTWYDGSTTGGVELLAGRAPETLPVITPELITNRFVPELEGRLAPLGVRVKLEGNGRVKADPRTVNQATVLLVHHSAIESPERGRGSSAFTGALDFIGAVTKRDAEIALKTVKNKNGPAGDILRWHLDEKGVLRKGGMVNTAPNHVGDECARAATATLRAISADKLAVSRSTLVDAMAEDYPTLFCKPDGTRDRSRSSRAIQTAVARNWVTENKGTFRPGPVEPPDIVDLLCAGEPDRQEVR